MHTHWLTDFTSELLGITDDVDRETAAEFVRKVYEAGREEGRREAEEGREHAGW